MQTGQIVSCSSQNDGSWSGGTAFPWGVSFTYQTDSGGTALAMALIGVATGNGVGNGSIGLLPLWSSPTSMVTIPLNLTPGTSNQVQLPCPPVVKTNAFGL